MAARAALALPFLMVLFGLLAGFPAEAQNSLEYAIKATYLYKLAPFVEWPPSVFNSASQPLVLCVAGDDPFGEVLDHALSNQQVGSHPIRLRRVPAADVTAGCHILYAAGSARRSVAQILDAVRGAPVLTVTDGARDPRARGMVHLVVHDNRVRFEVDERAAAESGLVISSKVLRLALSVRPRE